jgi:signal transduction histidine kinase/CheY-like chemotaxis protein
MSNLQSQNIGYVKSEIRSQAFFVLVALFLFLAMFLVDAKPRLAQNAQAPQLLALGLVAAAMGGILFNQKEIEQLRWLPLIGLVLLPLPVAWFVDSGAALLVIAVTVVAVPLMFDAWVGGLVLLLNTLLLARAFPALGLLEPGHVFGLVVLLWGLFGLIAVATHSLFEIFGQLMRKYDESSVLIEESRRAQSELNSLILERTEANQQLARLNQLANNMRAIAENERVIKEEFIANVSHELRTPLNMVIGFCNVIFRSMEAYQRKLPKTLMADLEVILRNSMHLSNLVNDILDLSQINAGQMAIVKERVNIEELINDAVIAVRPLFESKALFLKIEKGGPPVSGPLTSGPLPEILCDRTRMREVLLNLLSNAGRFTEEGGVTISTALEQGKLAITVSDTGIGISREKQARLFEPFYQADASIRKKYGGTGLGLAISKQIIELHGGQIQLMSNGEPGMGTTFKITLPVETALLASGKSRFSRWINPYMPPAHAPHRPWSADATLQPRVVVVDEDDDLTHMLRRYMGDYEYERVQAVSQGIDHMISLPARFLLVNATDIETPLHQIQQSGSLPFGAVAIVCSIPSNQRLWASHLDIKDTLIKPISRDQLVACLAQVGTRAGDSSAGDSGADEGGVGASDVEDGGGENFSAEASGAKEHAITALIVDDDPEIRGLFRRMLLTAGREYRVLTADNGRHALQVMKREKVDAIFLDLVMPRMDGIQFLEAKKKLPGGAEIPVFLISGHQASERTMASAGLGIQVGGGMTIKQFLECINALSAILSPSEERAPLPTAVPAE